MRSTAVVLLLITLIGLVAVGFYLTNPQASQQLLVELELATPAAEMLRASGFLEARQTALSSREGGQIANILVSEGQVVEAGQAVAQLDPTLLKVYGQLAQSRSDAARVQLEMLQTGLRPQDEAVARAAVALAQAVLDGARQAREDASSGSPIQTREGQVALAEAQVERAVAELQAVQADMEALLSGPDQDQLAAARAQLDAAQSELAALQDRIDAMTIRATGEGVVLQRLALPGEVVMPGQPLLTVADLQQLDLVVYIPEGQLNWVQLGDTAWVMVDAYPDRLFPGQVIFISDQAEFTPRNVQTPQERAILVYAVKIHISNMDGALKPGLPAVAVFEGDP